jgi:hypothetical protein
VLVSLSTSGDDEETFDNDSDNDNGNDSGALK